ncbi:hypothetical protein LOAG_13210 [Loa loa]|uniref:Uncharacterized protein n=1 Tax=Loa loa TaxID=7209 RepID=A0A1S0TJW2_LOALO|nr:hypothetical protein LOAG_13210 [Loa loa]EFO15301.1 hypothetical protein LOAG_13210 [Loa loa]
MAKLIVHIAFFIYCQAAAPAARGGVGAGERGVAAEVVTDYKTDKLWEDGRLIATTKVEESISMNCGTVEDGPLFILMQKPFLSLGKSLDLIK